MARLVHVKHARRAYKEAGIKKGEPYYWYKHRYGPKVRSKTAPRRSSYATQSEFIGELMDMEYDCGALLSGAADLDEAKSNTVDQLREWASRCEEMGQECTEKRDNMPEQLQDSDSGSLLESRSEEMETLAQELNDAADTIDGLDIDNFKDDAVLALAGEHENEEGEDDEYVPPEDEVLERANESALSEVEDALSSVGWSYS